MPAMQQPKAYLTVGDGYFAADGKIAAERARGYAKKIIDSFAAWIETNLK